jgi:hypothetical protein
MDERVETSHAGGGPEHRSPSGLLIDGVQAKSEPAGEAQLRKRDKVVNKQRVSRLARAGLTLGLTLVVSGIFASTAQAGSGAQPLFPGVSPRTDGTTVVYQTLAGPGESDVVAASIADRLQFPIAIGDGAAITPDIDNGIAVWVQENPNGNLDVRGRDIEAESSFLVAGGDGNEVLPAISGWHVVYVTSPKEMTPGAVMTLQVVDLTDHSVKTLDSAPVGAGSGGFLRPVISDDRVVWVRLEQIGDHVVHWQLKTQRLSDASAALVTEEDLDIGGPLGALSTPAYDVAGDTLVYSADLNLFALNLSNGQQTTIASITNGDYKPAQNPTTDGRYVFWQDYRVTGTVSTLVEQLQATTLESKIMGYDLLTGAEFPVVVDGGYNVAPEVRNGMLVWEHHQTLATDPTVYSEPFARAVPALYFPETGHSISGRFLTFWQNDGALPVFGYPRTDELSENGMTVQYFERQRFEYHPELEGTPYVVELGLTGLEDAQRRDIDGSAPFQPLTNGATSDGYTEFFTETGHRLGGGFRAYWHAHGLNMGDEGISQRESLALFGFPISEEFTDPSTGFTVQYFERARFEYHPENPEPYTILLGRLTADGLTR